MALTSWVPRPALPKQCCGCHRNHVMVVRQLSEHSVLLGKQACEYMEGVELSE